MQPLELFRKLHACNPALKWVAEQSDQSLPALWAGCPQGDWMLWYLGYLGARDGYRSPAHRRVVMASCLCARTALPYTGVLGDAAEALLGRIEAWAQGRPVGITLLRKRERALRRATSSRNAIPSATQAVTYTLNVIANPVPCAAGVATYAADAVGLSASSGKYSALFYEARKRHHIELANLLRNAIPVVPE